MTEDNPYTRIEPQSRRRGGLADEVAGCVRDLILAGALKPGTMRRRGFWSGGEE